MRQLCIDFISRNSALLPLSENPLLDEKTLLSGFDFAISSCAIYELELIISPHWSVVHLPFQSIWYQIDKNRKYYAPSCTQRMQMIKYGDAQ